MKIKLTPRGLRWLALALLTLGSGLVATAAEAAAELKDISINGGVDDGKARLVIEALLGRTPADRLKLIYATSLQQTVRAGVDRLQHEFVVAFDVYQGDPRELPLTITGQGEIVSVEGEGLQDWSVRRGTNATRALVLRTSKAADSKKPLQFKITAEQRGVRFGETVPVLTLTPEQPALFSGYVRVEPSDGVHAQAEKTAGIVPLDAQFLPEAMRGARSGEALDSLAFRFQGTAYSLSLNLAASDPELNRVTLTDFDLVGRLGDSAAAFTLTAKARVRRPTGGMLELLSGKVGLTQEPEGIEPRDAGGAADATAQESVAKDASPGELLLRDGRFVLKFNRPGEFPIRIHFNAAVAKSESWNTVEFRVAPGILQTLRLQGLPADTQFRETGAVRPERQGEEFRSFVPADGTIKLSWQEARPETEGKLFFAAEMLAQIAVAPGLVSEAALVEFKVMQGELNQLMFLVRGAGEITRVHGDPVLAWTVDQIANSADRRLRVQLNQAQKDRFSLQVETRTPLNSFPQTFEPLQLRPEGATRFAGYYRIINDGAVRLEIEQASGLSQVAPEQFPESDVTQALFRPGGGQRFVYRFSGVETALRIQADQILPELTVSAILVNHLTETEVSVDAELELEIREAPLRELLLRIPRGFALARLTAPGLSDYVARDVPNTADAEIRLLYAQPATGRQLIQARLERNQALAGTNWALPSIEVVRAKSTRGHVGVSAEAGFRLTSERVQGLTEIATAFFPKKTAGLQMAFRITDAAWQATLTVERQAHALRADALHLFSIGEGIAYGSSVINYLVSGAPVSAFRFELSNEYFNVEFAGKDVRNWQKTTNGYVVQLHSAVLGPYTLLATYERPFRAQGESLVFTGARPLDVQSEQGHTLITSAYQFRVQPVEVSPGLLALEAGEVPGEYRLLFDAPVLAAYRYTSRPFNLRLALSPLTQADSLSQVVDRALLTTRVSKAGQVLTDARYFVKSRGHPYFQLALPPGVQLWAAAVNGASVVPVTNATENLIPLPQRTDANAVLQIDVKLASHSAAHARVAMQTPRLAAPILLTEWKVSPDTGQRLLFRSGSLTPDRGARQNSGFDALARMFSGDHRTQALLSAGAALALLFLSVVVWRWTLRRDVTRFSAQWVWGVALGTVSFFAALAVSLSLSDMLQASAAPSDADLVFLAPIQQAGGALDVSVANVESRFSVLRAIGYSWPALLAVLAWGYALLAERASYRALARLAGWVLLAWAALRWPNGGLGFIVVVQAFLVLHLLLPAWRRAMRMPAASRPSPPEPEQPSTAPAVALVLCCCWLSPLALAHSAEASGNAVASRSASLKPEDNASRTTSAPAAAWLRQEIRIEEEHVSADLKLRWHAARGATLPVVYDPAVLTSAAFPTGVVKLVRSTSPHGSGQMLLGLDSGDIELRAGYQMQVTNRGSGRGVLLPTPRALVNEVQITIVNADVEVQCPAAVLVERTRAGSNTVARLVLAPAGEAWISWKPRSRDAGQEETVFYAETAQLYVPGAGLIEGAYHVQVRPAHGQVRELTFAAPAGAAITDVADAASAEFSSSTNHPSAASKPLVSLWRYDPDARQLRVSLREAQSRAFSLLIRSQIPTGSLPAEHVVGLLSVLGAAVQVGLMGLATGDEVQVENVTVAGMSPINIEDFPATALKWLPRHTSGLTLRRAYRYLDASGSARWNASAVQPDVRVESQNTVSIGEDRTVLAATASVAITRAGVFRLSFPLPSGFDPESITGASLSHWTESRTGAERILTLHLRGKTEGEQSFAITLTGPGVKAATNWITPRILFREASKQQGTLMVSPEQGLRLQVVSREGVTQLDPAKSGIQQKGVLAFRLLQSNWSLALDAERVEPWIQVTSLQHATVSEALVKVAANLQYQIENAGLKNLRVYLPANAETVHFQGEQLADFRQVSGVSTNGLQLWDIKLHRRVIGQYVLRLSYQLTLPEAAGEAILRGIEAADVNLQRGFVTVQSGARLQLSVTTAPPALQPVEWQSIPKALQQDLQAAAATFAFRLVERTFSLPIRLERRAAAKLLPARVVGTTLTSVVSDEGVMLTQVRMDLIPGDKRLLHVTLPKDAQFWFAFVGPNGVWPWREGDQVLIPLEQQSRSGQLTPLEFYFSSQAGAVRWLGLDLDLQAPKFDLPLENIAWRVYLDDKWQLRDWSGSLQLEEKHKSDAPALSDSASYLEKERTAQREKTKQAQDLIAFGNTALQQGDPHQARRAFQAAFGLSQGDDAFNEDARVQLNNVKVQQALVALNVRQAAAAGESVGERFRELRAENQVMNFTPQDAKQLFARNSIDDNAAFGRLAERLIQQQDAALPSPAAIRANIPEQGQTLTFKRSVVVDTWADLGVRLSARRAELGGWRFRVLTLGATLLLFGAALWAVRRMEEEAG